MHAAMCSVYRALYARCDMQRHKYTQAHNPLSQILTNVTSDYVVSRYICTSSPDLHSPINIDQVIIRLYRQNTLLTDIHIRVRQHSPSHPASCKCADTQEHRPWLCCLHRGRPGHHVCSALQCIHPSRLPLG